MKYKLVIIVQKPGDNHEDKTKETLNATTNDAAITKAKDMLKDGDYGRFETDGHQNHYYTIIGYLSDENNKDVAVITIEYEDETREISIQISK